MVLDQEFPPDDRVYKEARSLMDNGFDVSIACYTFTDKPLREEFKGIHIYRRRINRFIYKSSVAALKFPIYFNWWKRYLNEVAKEQSFDIIHIHDLPLAQVGVYFKKKFGVKLVVDLHENWPSYLTVATHTNTFFGKLLSNNKQWRAYEKDVLKQADLIVTVVEEMSERIQALGHDAYKIVALPNTIEPAEYQQLQKLGENERFTLFFAGGINIERGLQYVIPALSLVVGQIPGVLLKIVGKGSYQSYLEELVKENKLENHVEFLGWKPLKEVLQMTAQADVTLIPHIKWEQTDCSAPNKLFQCVLAKAPLLVSNCKSVERIVLETQSGLSYHYDNMHEFAEKLVYLYKNQALRHQMGENGYSAVINQYNWQTTCRLFINQYKLL